MHLTVHIQREQALIRRARHGAACRFQCHASEERSGAREKAITHRNRRAGLGDLPSAGSPPAGYPPQPSEFHKLPETPAEHRHIRLFVTPSRVGSR